MSHEHSIEQLCDCGYEVEINTDWSDVDPGCNFVACHFYLEEGSGCTYFKWVAPKGTKLLEKENKELKDEVLNLKRQIDDMKHKTYIKLTLTVLLIVSMPILEHIRCFNSFKSMFELHANSLRLPPTYLTLLLLDRIEPFQKHTTVTRNEAISTTIRTKSTSPSSS